MYSTTLFMVLKYPEGRSVMTLKENKNNLELEIKENHYSRGAKMK